MYSDPMGPSFAVWCVAFVECVPIGVLVIKGIVRNLEQSRQTVRQQT
jgi:hypothetical protein